MSDHSRDITHEQFYYFKRQDVSLGDFESPGLILDIGGGGEGIIGRLKGQQVIAIDSSRIELEEAPAGPLKIVMDACSMQFLDCAFYTTTSFFSLMYFEDEDHEKLFQEVFRILMPGGRFLIWDANIPCCIDGEKEIAAIPVRIRLSDSEEVNTGYGTPWPTVDHDMDYYRGLAEKTGFLVLSKRTNDHVIYLELQKPKIIGLTQLVGGSGC
jgi:SAM-dependent methyltransferase